MLEINEKKNIYIFNKKKFRTKKKIGNSYCPFCIVKKENCIVRGDCIARWV